MTPLFPSLVPLVSPDGCCAEMQGLSLRNVGLTIEDGNGRVLYRDFGEMLFTHFGLSGPMILSASSRLHEADIAKTTAVIDLKPALDTETLRARLQADFTKYANRIYGNALCDLLPSGMIPVFVRKSGVPGEKKVHQLTKEDRQRVLALLKRFPVPLSGYRPMAEAIVTCGGVNVREVDPKTMQSRLCPGLYFAGEMLDVDAYTGGYNLQIAFSTGHLAGESAALAE